LVDQTAAQVETLVPDKLYALGATVENDGRISSVVPGGGGQIPLNSFLLTEGTTGLLIDTSLPIIGEQLVQQAAAFELETVALVFTRVVEFDSVGNAELLEQVLPIDIVYSHFLPSQWMYFRAAPDPPPRRRHEPRPLVNGEEISVGGERRVTVIDAKLKLLATAWLYDHETRVLFTSDSFSHAPAPAPGGRVLTEPQDDITLEDVAGHLRTKFDWLEGADTEPLRRFLDDVFSTFDVQNIAPTFGCVLAGGPLVERHVSLVDEALRDLGARR
jgi:flavorubredoxin